MLDPLLLKICFQPHHSHIKMTCMVGKNKGNKKKVPNTPVRGFSHRKIKLLALLDIKFKPIFLTVWLAIQEIESTKINPIYKCEMLNAANTCFLKFSYFCSL